MALDTFKGMAVFRYAIELGSIAAAGKAAEVSAEMAGHHLKALEARLGVRLLNRTTRRLSPTEAGRAYYVRCAAILDEVVEAEAEASARQAIPRGLLRIAAPLAFTTALMAPAVAAFTERHPAVSIDMELSERNVDLLKERFDLALRLGELAASGLVARRLAVFSLIPVAAPSYLEKNGTPRRPRDLGEHQALLYTQTATPREWTFQNTEGRREDVSVRGAVSASDVTFLHQLAIAGAGVALMPDYVVRDSLETGRLMQLLPKWQARLLPLYAVTVHRTWLPAAVRGFSDFIAAWFARWGEPARRSAK